MIKAIVFDYAGVITPGPMTSWIKENLKETDKKYKLYKTSGDKWDLGLVPKEKVLNILSEVTGVAPNEIWEKIYLKPKLNSELISFIKALRQSYKIYIFSNFISEFLKKLLEKDNILGLFDEVIVSSDYGMKKPDPTFFKLLVSKTGVLKNEILFTDDAIKNVRGANKYGIKSILYTDNKTLIKDFRNLGIII